MTKLYLQRCRFPRGSIQIAGTPEERERSPLTALVSCYTLFTAFSICIYCVMNCYFHTDAINAFFIRYLSFIYFLRLMTAYLKAYQEL